LSTSGALFDTSPDSVDKRPSYEVYAIHKGKVKHADLASIVQPIIQERLLPFVKAHYSCDSCAVCHVLVRRYLASERSSHPNHFDQLAYITAVTDLDPDQHEGGLYVQLGPEKRAREFLPNENGSMVMHQYDLDHGVSVWNGTRHSLIFWLKPASELCSTNLSPWYQADAESGDADSQNNLAGCYKDGGCGFAADLKKSAMWYKQAAKQGHWQALCSLAGMYADGLGVQRDEKKARQILKKAAKTGYAVAQRKLGEFLEHGKGDAKDLEGAASLFLQAAQQDDSEAQFRLAWAYIFGKGVAQNVTHGLQWMQEASALGHAHAHGALGEAYWKGRGVV